MEMKKPYITFILISLSMTVSACSGMTSWMGIHRGDNYQPISNPFAHGENAPKYDVAPPMVLRTKKGDRSLEVEIPHDSQQQGDVTLPLSSAFNSKKIASISSDSDDDSVDNAYR